MFGWIPIIGPIIDGIFSFLNKTLDLKVVKYKVDGQVDMEAMRQSTAMAQIYKDDIGLRVCRDLICFPVSVWFALYTWDTIWAGHDRSLMWKVADFPPQTAYVPIVVASFLLGNIGFNIFRRIFVR